MEYIEREKARPAFCLKDYLIQSGGSDPVTLHGAIHRIRDMGHFSFLLVRLPDTIIQCVLEGQAYEKHRPHLHEECCVRLTGVISAEERAPHGLECHIQDMVVLSSPAAPLPFPVNRHKIGPALETELGYRPIALRNSDRRARFRVQAGIVQQFRNFLQTQGFTEIRSPKLQSASAEGGANVFSLDYFGKKAYLAQSPQFYKQMMVGVYERVFEVGSVFRAERHQTARHLNEYVSLDFEMGYIDDFTDLCAMETAMLASVFDYLRQSFAEEIQTLKVSLPSVDRIPSIRFVEAKELVARTYNRKIKDPHDLEPEEERLISDVIKRQTGSDFVFVTHYPASKRPFYAMNDPENPKLTLSFDLLFRGLEITTGGQRIHDYDEQVAKMVDKGLAPEDFKSYLMAHRHGMPPHGGLGIGLERLCMKLFGDSQIRLSSMFPRDMGRLDP